MKQSIRTFVFPTQTELITRLVSAGYAFAAWRMPNATDWQMIISLQDDLSTTDSQLSDLGTGFIANSFADSHPVAPSFIKADIVIKEGETSIAPTVSDSQLDQLEKAIQKTEPARQTDKPHSANPVEHGDMFQKNVAQAVSDIRSGDFEKVVLSRYLDEELPEGFSLWRYFEQLCDAYPNAFCSLTFIPKKGVWIGATPELLISENQQRFKTVALAGTKPLTDGQSLSEIAWTQKEIEEQAFVSRYIINCFKKIRLREFHEHGPKTVKAGNLAHLKTIFEVNYDEVTFDGLADQLLDLLHPTSAVCGMPIETAKPWIKEHEAYNRELYAGFLGPVNYEHSTDLFVNLRCAKIEGNNIRYFAGAGITEDSNPKKEYEETELKINVLRSIINS